MTVTHDEFQQFFVNIATARRLLDEAQGRGSLIEGTILYAASIDAMLRQLILMERSIKAKGSIAVPDGFIWQYEEDKIYSEREIMKIAKDDNVISDNFFTELNSLYNERNKIVHRYIISWYKYSDLINLLNRYEKIYRNLFSRIEKYERPDLHKSSDEEIIEMWDRVRKKL